MLKVPTRGSAHEAHHRSDPAAHAGGGQDRTAVRRGPGTDGLSSPGPGIDAAATRVVPAEVCLLRSSVSCGRPRSVRRGLPVADQSVAGPGLSVAIIRGASSARAHKSRSTRLVDDRPALVDFLHIWSTPRHATRRRRAPHDEQRATIYELTGLNLDQVGGRAQFNPVGYADSRPWALPPAGARAHGRSEAPTPRPTPDPEDPGKTPQRPISGAGPDRTAGCYRTTRVLIERRAS